MNLKNVSNEELKLKLQRIEKFEKRADRVAVECIAEIDHRKLYLAEAFPSLFEYLVDVFHYSPAKAQRRIDAARALKLDPEIAEKIELGELTITQISQVEKAARAVRKLEGRALSTADKSSLFAQISGASQKQTEVILAQALNLPFEAQDREQFHHDGSVTVTVTFSRDQMELLRHIQNAVSHAVPEKSWARLFAYLAEKERSRRFGRVAVFIPEGSLP